MHSVLSRANAVFAFTLSVLAGVTAAAFFTTAFEAYSAPVIISTTNAQVKNLPDYSAARARNDLGFINFNVSVDVSPLFNWNVKQLFLYLVAEYKTPQNSLNQVVLWDKIILRGEDSVVDIVSGNPKYYFWDDGNGLIGHQDVTLTLHWNVIPNAGTLPMIRGAGSHAFAFPQAYTSAKF